jgi:hypothetical protein
VVFRQQFRKQIPGRAISPNTAHPPFWPISMVFCVVDIFRPNKGIASLIITKIIVIAVLGLIAWHIAGKAGYL